MTEQEFLNKIQGDDSTNSYSALLALELAKKHGAQFDHQELVELPPLRVGSNAYGFEIELQLARISNGARTYVLSLEQAEEIVRRCELIPRLRKYIVNSVTIPNRALIEMIDMIDGKIK